MVFKLYSTAIKVPVSLHHHPELLIQDRIDAVYATQSERRSRNQDSSAQTIFLNLLLSNFGELM